MFMLLWYNGSSKKIHLGAELAARARWYKNTGFSF